jgi:hypothetical protein
MSKLNVTAALQLAVLTVKYHTGPQCLGYKLKKEQQIKLQLEISTQIYVSFDLNITNISMFLTVFHTQYNLEELHMK